MPKLHVWLKTPDGNLIERWDNLPGDWDSLEKEERQEEIDELLRTFVNDNIESGYEVVKNPGDRS